MPLRPCQHAFTLVELSIVLVVIGLIIGGTLVGREMVQAAEIRGTLAQIDKYKQAYAAFLGKYNCVPGDCRNASTYGLPESQWLITNAQTDGDGDGLISSDRTTTLANNGRTALIETWDAFSHLFGVKMISDVIRIGNQGARSNIPINNGLLYFTSLRYASQPAWYRTPDRPGNYLYIGLYPGNNTDFSGTDTVLKPQEAYAIDVKLDDGLPMSGTVKASGISSADCAGNPRGWRSGPCFNQPTIYSWVGWSGSACVDDRVMPNIYWMGSTQIPYCTVHLPVN